MWYVLQQRLVYCQPFGTASGSFLLSLGIFQPVSVSLLSCLVKTVTYGGDIYVLFNSFHSTQPSPAVITFHLAEHGYIFVKAVICWLYTLLCMCVRDAQWKLLHKFEAAQHLQCELCSLNDCNVIQLWQLAQIWFSVFVDLTFWRQTLPWRHFQKILQLCLMLKWSNNRWQGVYGFFDKSSCRVWKQK